MDKNGALQQCDVLDRKEMDRKKFKLWSSEFCCIQFITVYCTTGCAINYGTYCTKTDAMWILNPKRKTSLIQCIFDAKTWQEKDNVWNTLQCFSKTSTAFFLESHLNFHLNWIYEWKTTLMRLWKTTEKRRFCSVSSNDLKND